MCEKFQEVLKNVGGKGNKIITTRKLAEVISASRPKDWAILFCIFQFSNWIIWSCRLLNFGL